MNRRVLIFGGTFDPPHIAHTRLPVLAAQHRGCAEIIYVPAAVSPLKTQHPPAASAHRLAMLVLAIADVPGARISTVELDRYERTPGPSFTIDTLRELHALESHSRVAAKHERGGGPDAARTAASDAGARAAVEFHLLIGCDQALAFRTWREWEAILTLATPAVMVRPPWTRETFFEQLRERFAPVEAERWVGWTLHLPLIDAAASDIRARVAANSPWDGLVSSAVGAYIRANRLYQADATRV